LRKELPNEVNDHKMKIYCMIMQIYYSYEYRKFDEEFLTRRYFFYCLSSL